MSDPVSYTGVLPIGESTAVRLAHLLDVERRRRGTRRGRRALGPWRQAVVLVLRWFLDATRVAQLAVDNQISPSTAYRYLHEGIDVLAVIAPGLHGALLHPWRAEAGSEWTRIPIARLRYTLASKTWTLYWRDRNLRFHRYDRIEPSANVGQLIDEIDRDPTGIFWG